MDERTTRRLNEIALIVNTHSLTVELEVGRDQDAALEELFEIVEADEGCRSVLENWGADRDALFKFFWFLIRAGAAEWAHGRYVPVYAIADPWTLEYLLACRYLQRLDEVAAGRVIWYYRTGCRDPQSLQREHAIAVTIMCGPKPPLASIYRPYSVTALHQYGPGHVSSDERGAVRPPIHREDEMVIAGPSGETAEDAGKRSLWRAMDNISIALAANCAVLLLVAAALNSTVIPILGFGISLAYGLSHWERGCGRGGIRSAVRALLIALSFLNVYGGFLLIWLPSLVLWNHLDILCNVHWCSPTAVRVISAALSVYTTTRYVKFINSQGERWYSEWQK